MTESTRLRAGFGWPYAIAIQKLTSLLLILVLAVATPGATSGVVPRKSPEFTINEPSGKQVLLSSFKGKVVMLEFFFLRSARCLNLVVTMNKLNAEFASRGFQPVAVAFPAPQSAVNGPLLADTVEPFKLTYPVGFANKEDVDQYFNRQEKEVLRIPQVIIIDRTGMIRAQTGDQDANANLKLESETYLRTMLDGLLKEGASAGSGNKK